MTRKYVNTFKDAAKMLGGEFAEQAKKMTDPRPLWKDKKIKIERTRGPEMEKTERKSGNGKGNGFFAKIDAMLARAYELADLFDKAEGREIKATLKKSPEYKEKVETLEREFATLDERGFAFLKKTGVGRVLENKLPIGIMFFLDKEARRRGCKYPQMPFARGFKAALEKVPFVARKKNGIYPNISHGMYLKIAETLKELGKYEEAMKFAETVPAKWRKPFEEKKEERKEEKKEN